jgi:cell wall-associated NlpC family hydrolase
MPALGILLIVFGAFVVREVIVGRAKETPTDLKDAASALLSGDTAGFGAVMARRGSNTSDALAPGGVDGPSLSGAGASGSNALAAECMRLGNSAKGYSLGATGPTYYDCSGLVWKACFNLGIYKGPRFTTATFEHVAGQFAKKIITTAGDPHQGLNLQSGDIVIWVSGGHMGVMLNSTEFYSARSPAKGIGSAPLSADVTYFGAQPDIWRVS